MLEFVYSFVVVCGGLFTPFIAEYYAIIKSLIRIDFLTFVFLLPVLSLSLSLLFPFILLVCAF